MIILDFETNTQNPYDVIEVGAFKVELQNGKYKVVDTFHRYYYSKYEVNHRAFEVHKLSPDKIRTLRGDEDYSEYFEDDYEFREFCDSCKTLVAHNITFELRYLGDMVYFDNHFCTMKENKYIVNALNIRGNIKPPKLIEVCEYYNINFDTNQYHSAIYDVTKTLDILNSMNNKSIVIY
jgi:DNA polymerase-3 subunit epsilon